MGMAMILTGCQSGSGPGDPSATIHRTGFTAEAVTTYYDTQGVRYLTRQFFEIDPESKSMTISSEEPEGPMRWSIRGDLYSGPSVGSAKAWYDRHTAKAILTAFLAGSGLLNESTLTTGDPVKIDGQWYHPLSMPEGNGTRVTVFRQQNRSVIDRVEVADSKSGDRYIGLAYNPLWNAVYGKSVITKIDLSKVVQNGSRRLIQVHFQTLDYSK